MSPFTSLGGASISRSLVFSRMSFALVITISRAASARCTASNSTAASGVIPSVSAASSVRDAVSSASSGDTTGAATSSTGAVSAGISPSATGSTASAIAVSTTDGISTFGAACSACHASSISAGVTSAHFLTLRVLASALHLRNHLIMASFASKLTRPCSSTPASSGCFSAISFQIAVSSNFLTVGVTSFGAGAVSLACGFAPLVSGVARSIIEPINGR